MWSAKREAKLEKFAEGDTMLLRTFAHMMTWQIDSLDDLELVAQAIVSALNEMPVVVFLGEMGAGKTTLIGVVCRELGVNESVSSPTYGLVHTYGYTRADGAQGEVHHMDLYRLASVDELFDAGIQEVFDTGDVALIEWPQVAESVLPERYWVVRIEAISATERHISLSRNMD